MEGTQIIFKMAVPAFRVWPCKHGWGGSSQDSKNNRASELTGDGLGIPGHVTYGEPSRQLSFSLVPLEGEDLSNRNLS